MTNDVLIGRVRELIRILQITQNEFADRIKTDRSNFSKHVNGKLPINDSLVNKIVVGLGVLERVAAQRNGKHILYDTSATQQGYFVAGVGYMYRRAERCQGVRCRCNSR